MTRAITTSCQPRPQPHITGTAAATASSGTPMNAASMTCSIRARRRVLGTDAIGPVRAPVVTGCAGGRIVVVGAVMRWSPRGTAPSSYLRQRNLRDRRFDKRPLLRPVEDQLAGRI